MRLRFADGRAAALAVLLAAGACGQAERVEPTVVRSPPPGADATSSPPGADAPSTPARSRSPAAALPGRIAVVGTDGRLVTVAADGSDQRVLTPAGVRVSFPAWAPDGERLAALASNGTTGELYILEDGEPALAADPPVPLYSSADRGPFYLYWAPDGRSVAFLAPEPPELALHVVGVEREAPSRIVARGQPLYWDWLDGGDRLLVHAGTGPDAQLGPVERDGDATEPRIAQPGLFQAPGVSPDGRYWAYGVFGEGGPDRLVIEDRQSGARQAAAHRGVAALAWSPTTDTVAYLSPERQIDAFLGPLRLLDARTGEGRLLADETVFGFFWSPDGQSIAYFAAPGQSDPGPVARSSTGLLAAWPPSGHAIMPVAQEGPLGIDLVVVKVDDGEPTLRHTFRPPSVFLEQFLPFFDQYARSHSIWSPDSSALVLPTLDEAGGAHIEVIPSDGGQPTVVAEGEMAFWSRP